MIAYRQEPSDKMLTHSSSQDSVLMGSLLRYTFTKEGFEERTWLINVKKKFLCLFLMSARHCLASIYQVNVSSAVRPYSFVLHAQSCLPSVVFHTHVNIECFNWVPFNFSNLPISTLSVHLSRLRVGQYFAIFVARFLCDNVEATLY